MLNYVIKLNNYLETLLEECKYETKKKIKWRISLMMI